jgi:hypothetical protein
LRKQASRFPRTLALEALIKELVTTLLRGFGADERALACIDWRD